MPAHLQEDIIVLADELKLFSSAGEWLFLHVCAFASAEKKDSFEKWQDSDEKGTGRETDEWDGSALFAYIEPSAAERTRFKEILSANGITWDVFTRVAKRPVTYETVQKLFIASARVKQASVPTFFIDYLQSRIRKDYKLFALREQYYPKIKDVLETVLEPSANSNNNKCPILDTLITTPDFFVSEREDAALSPRNFHSILHGRKAEIEQLNDFLDDDSKFEFLFVVAPSGAGKTRLVTQWFVESEITKLWQGGFVEDNTKTQKWREWFDSALSCDALIIVDYIYQFKDIVRGIIKMGKKLSRDSNSPRLRLIVLDHVLPKAESVEDFSFFHKDILGDDAGSIAQSLDKMDKYPPLYLKQSKEMLKSIISDAFRGNEESKIEFAYETLLRIDAENKNDSQGSDTHYASHPLFAILIGRALNSNSLDDIRSWQRRDLINQYFTEKRLPWNYEDKGQWISAAIAASTAIQGIDYESIIEKLIQYGISLNGKEQKDFIGVCNQFVSSHDENELKRYEPDILGETLFLLFYEHFCRVTPNNKGTDNDVISLFFKLLCNESDRGNTYPKPNKRFIEFIERTTRNLINDDQESRLTKDGWKTLARFLNPDNFECKDMRFSSIVAKSKIVEMLRTTYRQIEERLERLFINSIHFEEMFDIFFSLVKSDISKEDATFLACLSSICFYLESQLTFGVLTKEIESATLRFLDDYERYAELDYKHYYLPAIFDAPNFLNWVLNRVPHFDINTQNKNRWAVLHIACGSRSHAVVESLVRREEINVNLKGYEGWTALMIACNKNDISTVNSLLSCKRNIIIDERDDKGRTALMFACQYAKPIIVEALISSNKEINPNITDNYKWTALMMACRYNDEFVVKAMVDSSWQIDLNMQDNEQWTALMFACRYGNFSMVSNLLNCGREINLDLGSYDGWTALMLACSRGDMSIVKTLLNCDKKINLNIGTHQNVTALMIACRKNNDSIVQCLLNCGKSIDPDLQTMVGESALMLACQHSSSKVARILLDKDWDITLDIQNKKGWTALMYACRYGNESIVRSLINCGKRIDLDIKDNEGCTALMLACWYGSVEAVNTLLNTNNNITLDIQDDEGWTALMLACRYGSKNKVNALLYCGRSTDLNMRNDKRWTALMMACHAKNTGIVECLINYCKKTDTVFDNQQVFNALAIVRENGCEDIAKLLTDHLSTLKKL